MKLLYSVTFLIFCLSIRPAVALERFQLNQLETLLQAPDDNVDLKKFDFLFNLLSYENYAKTIIAMLSNDRFAKGLPRFQPFSWPALDKQLCVVAGVDSQRCLSLSCFMLDSAPDGQRSCPLDVIKAIREAEGTPINLPSQEIFATWLNNLALRLDGQEYASIKELLSSNPPQLPINYRNITAKSALHEIWPALVEVFRRFEKVKPEQLVELVRLVAIKEQKRALDSVWIISLDNFLAIEGLNNFAPELVDAIGENASWFRENFTLKDQNNIGILTTNREEVDRRIDRVKSMVATMQKKLANIIAVSPAAVVDIIAEEICPKPRLTPLIAISNAKEFGGVGFSIGLLETGRLDNGRLKAELAIAIKSENPAASVSSGVKKKLADAKCKEGISEVIPLGISIYNVKRTDSGPRFVASKEILVQSTEIVRTKKGLEALIAEAGSDGAHTGTRELGSTIEILDASISFDDDFRNVDLLLDVRIPVLNINTTTRTQLVNNGELVFEPNVESLLELEQLIAKINKELAQATRNQDVKRIGPFSFAARLAELQSEANRRAGNWLLLTGVLSSEGRELGEVKVELIRNPNDTVELALKSNLTPLFRKVIRGIISELTDAGQSLHTQATNLISAKVDPRIVNRISDVLLIDKVEMGNKENILNVTLAIDIEAISGQTDCAGIAVTRPLDFSVSDFGLVSIYGALLTSVLDNKNCWMQQAMNKLNTAIANASEEAIENAIEFLSEKLNESGLNAKFEFEYSGLMNLEAFSSDKRIRNLIINSSIGRVEIRSIAIVVGDLQQGVPPRIDFSNATIDGDAGTRLSKMIQKRIVELLNQTTKLGWLPCGTPNINLSRTGFHLELSAQTTVLGCMPLPSIKYDGSTLGISFEALQNLLEPLILRTAYRLAPESIRKFIKLDKIRFGKKLASITVPFSAKVPPLTQYMNGEFTINLRDLSISNINIKNKDALFKEALGGVISNIMKEGGLKVEMLQDEIGLRASFQFDLLEGSNYTVTAKDLKITTSRIHLPDVNVQTPLQFAVGPIILTPIEFQIGLSEPYRVAIAGDGQFVGTGPILKLRTKLGFVLNDLRIDHRGIMVLASTMNLFETTGTLDFLNKTIDADARTVGPMNAVLPFQNSIHIDPVKAETNMTASVLGVKINGEAVINFTEVPDLTISGSLDAGSLSNLEAGLETDLELSDPSITAKGKINFLIDDIDFEAKANLHRTVVRATVAGLSASVVVPNLRSLNEQIIKDLFEALLKPSIDLSLIEELNITISPMIAGGGEGIRVEANVSGSDSGENAGDNGKKLAAEGLQQSTSSIQHPEGSILARGVPSEYQDGFLPSPTRPDAYCWARWKSRDKIADWGPEQVPIQVAQQLVNRNPGFPNYYLKTSNEEYTMWENCSKQSYTNRNAKVSLYFNGTDIPFTFRQGSLSIKETVWVNDVIKKIENRSASQITKNNRLSSVTVTILQLFAAHEAIDAALITPVTIPNGQSFFIISLDNYVYLVDKERYWKKLQFEKESNIADILLQIAENPNDASVLRDFFLPNLWSGGNHSKMAYFTMDYFLFSTGTRLIAFSISKNQCAPWVTVKDGRLSSSGPFAQIWPVLGSDVLLAQGCERPNEEWEDIRHIVKSNANSKVNRLVLTSPPRTDNTWKLAFTQEKANNHCLRIDLNQNTLTTAMKNWVDIGAMTQDQMNSITSRRFGYEAVLEAIKSIDIAWNKVGFPLNPFSLTKCR